MSDSSTLSGRSEGASVPGFSAAFSTVPGWWFAAGAHTGTLLDVEEPASSLGVSCKRPTNVGEFASTDATGSCIMADLAVMSSSDGSARSIEDRESNSTVPESGSILFAKSGSIFLGEGGGPMSTPLEIAQPVD